jgi:hypothetical protein
MGLFRRKPDLLTTGLPGTAVIVSERRLDIRGDDSDGMDLLEQRFGSYKFGFELEVTLDDGRPPYTVSDTFKVPAPIGGHSGPGVTLPVFVDPDNPNRVEVDWERFAAEGGAKAFEEAYERKREEWARKGMAKADAADAQRLDADVAAGKMTQADADEHKRITAMASAGELDDEPGINASPRETLDWQLKKGLLDQATYDAIIAANPKLK